MRRIAVTKFINLRFNDQTEGIEHVLFDSQRMQQVLISLMTNAINDSKVNSVVTITLRNEESQDKKLFILIYVQDLGLGIKPELQKYVFMPFGQREAQE